MTEVFSIAIGYALGAIPFGLVLTRLAGYGDIREIGSGNIGATNVLRTGNKPLAAATLVLDAGKGAIAVAIAASVWGGNAALLAGAAAMVGHCFPVWLGFKGGKGVATTLGTLLMALPLVGGAACVTWLVMAAVFRISSLSALVAVALSPVVAAFVPLLVWIGGPPNPTTAVFACVVIASVVIYRHKENINRLRSGTEPRIGGAKKD